MLILPYRDPAFCEELIDFRRKKKYIRPGDLFNGRSCLDNERGSREIGKN